MIADHGLCIVADKYFEDFPSIRHMSNKHESRPYYLAVRSNAGIIWLIPISSQVEKYRSKIEEIEKNGKECFYYYIARLKGKDSAFLIGNPIPVTEQYIKKPFTLQGRPFVVEDKQDIKKIQSKFSRYLALVRAGKLKPAVDILGIERKLINRQRESKYII